jgi:uncharacterized protein DUF559
VTRWVRILLQVAPRARVPPELTRGPFTPADAARAGLTRWHLRSSPWRRVAHGLYVWGGLAETPTQALFGAVRRLPPGATFSGRTAAWVHGLDEACTSPIEVTVPASSDISARSRLAIRRAQLDSTEVVERAGLRVTSVLRTVLDLGQSLPLIESVAIADAALHRRLLSLDALRSGITARDGTRNVVRLRRLVQLVDPLAESPMESRLRTLLVLAGLPRPRSQVNLYDPQGRWLARADLYYAESKLVIEYDGASHRLSLTEDNRRQNRLLNAGYRILRFTAADVLGRPEIVVAQVRNALEWRQ